MLKLTAGKLIIILFLFLIIFIPFFIFFLSKNQKIKAESLTPVIESIKRELPKRNPLEKIALENLLNNEGEYAVVIKNLKTGESYLFNGTKKFDSASLYKLWVMVVAFQKIDEGTLKKTDLLSAPIEKLDETLSTTTPTPTPENQSPTPVPTEVKMITMNVEEAIEKMITISDNYAALLVASRSGTRNIFSFLKDNGFSNSTYNLPPVTTAKDIAVFYEKLYRGEFVNKKTSDEMIEILKKQELNDRIPKYLPEGTVVAHKTGELFKSKHDSGIVFSKKGDYIIVVMSETKDARKATENIAIFSKKIYDYFNN